MVAEKFERLPRKVVPAHYDLHLKPNLTTFIFEGEETIHMEVNSFCANTLSYL